MVKRSARLCHHSDIHRTRTSSRSPLHKRSQDRHELTIVLVDATGHRVGDAAFVREFVVDRDQHLMPAKASTDHRSEPVGTSGDGVAIIEATDAVAKLGAPRWASPANANRSRVCAPWSWHKGVGSSSVRSQRSSRSTKHWDSSCRPRAEIQVTRAISCVTYGFIVAQQGNAAVLMSLQMAFLIGRRPNRRALLGKAGGVRHGTRGVAERLLRRRGGRSRWRWR